jgi:S-DNA-T family DNA segregation ATPase FtsK/SpoIIIE
VKVNGTRVEDLAGTGLVTKQRWVLPLWLSVPLFLVRVTGRVAWMALVWTVRAWAATVPVALLVVAYVRAGGLGVTAMVTCTLAAGLVWAYRWPGSYSRLVARRVRGAWRWWSRYRHGWHPAMDGTGLTRTTPSRMVYVPRVTRVRSTRVVDTLHVRLLHGQTPEEMSAAAEGLRHVFEAHRAKVVEEAPGRVRIVFYARDPLTRTIAPIEPAAVPDLGALPVGLSEDGDPYRLRIKGRHILIAGASDAGKASVLWSLIRALAPGVAAGTVELQGIDPKRMELVFAPELFTRLEDRDTTGMVQLLEDNVSRMQARQDLLSGKSRQHIATPGDPTVVIVVDELASLTAYLPNRDLRQRAESALSLLLSQGRAVGFHVVGALQDPRKDIVKFRDLFTLRIALRLTEDSHVDMVLGDGALDRGALCHRIPDHLPGVGYVHVEGAAEPVRVRFTYIDDDELRRMAQRWPAPGNESPVRVDVRQAERSDR